MDIEKVIHAFFEYRVGVLATMHKKEEVIAPILEKKLGIKIIIPEGFNSDQFGTFTGDVERMGNQLEAARYKAVGAMELCSKTLAIASEGSFGPHPFIPFIPYNREIVLVIDKENGMEISGIAATTETNYNQKIISNFEEAYTFSLNAGFPEHGIIIKLSSNRNGQIEMIKGITKKSDLEDAVNTALKHSHDSKIHIETDMRAMYNPTRMKNIEAAAKELVKNIYTLCPKCRWPGFKLIDSKKGLLCSWCGLPTNLRLSDQYSCDKCGYIEEKMFPNGIEKADPGNCQYCNP